MASTTPPEHERPMRVLSVFGTRPEAIKMAPVIARMRAHESGIETRVCVTGQHREMLDQVLDLFDLDPDFDLDVMRPGQSPTTVAWKVMARLEPVLDEVQPDWVLVQGDTTTVMAAAIAAFYAKAKVGHLEAGLRTWSRHHPFPEEINRRVTGVTTDLHFAPTLRARQNLLIEGVVDERILVTGNTVIDALHEVAAMPYDPAEGPLARVDWSKRIVLATTHRRENFGRPLHNICGALFDVAERHPEVEFVFSVHPNPEVQGAVHSLLDGIANITLLPPLDYLPFVYLMKRATIVLSDSGGVQEEAPGLGIPTLVLREVTERPEAVEAGTVKLIGTGRRKVRDAIEKLLTDERAYDRMANTVNPYGDGRAAERVVEACIEARHHTPAVLDLAGSSPALPTQLRVPRLSVPPFEPTTARRQAALIQAQATAG
jgi:UDP-N-acetylglucosamine 2-epimerase (non-hydrolysing)